MTKDERTVFEAFGPFWVEVTPAGCSIYKDGGWNNPEPIQINGDWNWHEETATEAIAAVATEIKEGRL